MDSTIQDIKFDENGYCQYCTRFFQKKNARNPILPMERNLKLSELLVDIKKRNSKPYDCIIGLSGGADSSYVIHLALELGLRPLVVHLDNGWNSELATFNINNLLNVTGFDLYTHVIQWEEYKDLQRSFIKANVVDIELLMDHAMIATLFKTASKYGIKHILTGINNSTEGFNFPAGWSHFKFDAKNILAIHQTFGSFKRLKTYPYIRLYKYIYYRYIKKIRMISFLDFVDYNKEKAIKLLEEKYNYRKYEKKHYENIFTRFYQAYILPKKFKIDKRIVHLSNLICTAQMKREDAINELQKDPYDKPEDLKLDYEFVLKKLEMSLPEFERYLSTPEKNHRDYPNEYELYRKLRFLIYKY
jgi:N-acetyl sugar amidotransferase